MPMERLTPDIVHMIFLRNFFIAVSNDVCSVNDILYMYEYLLHDEYPQKPISRLN